MVKEKARDMKLHTPRIRGFFGGLKFLLYEVSPGTKKLEKQFTVGELKDKRETKYKESDYKEIIDYIKDNEINVTNKDKFKWLK